MRGERDERRERRVVDERRAIGERQMVMFLSPYLLGRTGGRERVGAATASGN